MITDTKLDFWVQNNLNVLLKGKRGCGKSTMVIDTFNRNGLKWLYFSTATLDPFVDFVGVPKEFTDDQGRTYLKNVMPEIWKDDDIEAIFLDEFNRSPAKVRNAALELIQFKSINGKKFKNLKIVWAAVNPDASEKDDEDEYDVERLDPAQVDRFHIIVDVPYSVNKSFFKSKFGDEGMIAVDWWNSQPEKLKNLISPRRLEYTLDVYKKNGDVRDVLPKGTNVADLITQLASGSFVQKLANLFNEKDEAVIRAEFLNDNFYNGTLPMILRKGNYTEFFPQYFPDEKINSLIVQNKQFRDNILKSESKVTKFYDNLKQILDAATGPKAVRTAITVGMENFKKLNNIDYVVQKYLPQGRRDTMQTSQERVAAASLLNNIDVSALNDSEIFNIFLINSEIGRRTNTDFWGDTQAMFKKIDESLIKRGETTENFYNKMKKTKPASGWGDAAFRRLQSRLQKLKLLP